MSPFFPLLSSLLFLPFSSSLAPATGNHGLSTPDCFLSSIMVNPPTFSTYLAEVTRDTSLSVSLDGGPPIPLRTLFHLQQPSPVFPTCHLEARVQDLKLTWTLFAPLSPEYPEWGFLPLLMGRLGVEVVEGPGPSSHFSRNVTLAFKLACGSDEGAQRACGGMGEYHYPSPSSAMNASTGLFVGAHGGIARGADCGPDSPPTSTLCASVTIEVVGDDEGQGGRRGGEGGLLVIGHHVSTGRYVGEHPTPLSLFTHAITQAPTLHAHHTAFVATLPLAPASTLAFPGGGEAVAWWLQAPILLTKGIEGRVLTMGYVELNARDSFWTTMLHAYVWPAQEALMIQESCEFQCTEGGGPPSYCQGDAVGKIPTCILPTIVRDDNIDITAFFVLRVGRHFAATGDEAFLEQVYPCVRAAIKYLESRCPAGEALPAAREESYWGSWLDVPFLKGRRLIADNSAVYLAALRVGAQAAKLLGARKALGKRNLQQQQQQPGQLRGGGEKRNEEGEGEGKSAPPTYREDCAAFALAFSRGQTQLLLPPPPKGKGQWDPTTHSLVDTWWSGYVSNYSLGDQFMGAFFSVLPQPQTASLLHFLTQGSASGLEGPYGIRALFPYLPHATDPWGGEYAPGVYANGGSYAWLTCGASLALLWGGEGEAGRRVWGKFSQQMLFGQHGGMPHVPYEYLHSDSGAPMGNAPQGWDGVCGGWAWMGGGVGWWRESSVWAWPPGGYSERVERSDEKLFNLDSPFSLKELGVWHRHTYHLTLPPPSSLTPAAAGKPSPSLLLPLTSLSGVGGGEEGGGAFFFRLSQATLTGVPTVVSGVRVGEEGKGGDFSWAQSFPCTPSATVKGQVACKVGGVKEVEVLVNLRVQKE